MKFNIYKWQKKTHKNCIWKKKFSLIEITSKIAVKRKDEKKLSKIESLLIVMLE